MSAETQPVAGLPMPAPKAEPEALPANEKELLRWAIENSTDAGNIRKDHLMSHEEFKEMWKDLCPDTVEELKSNLAVVRSGTATGEPLYLALDKLMFIVEDIDAADWFVDLDGYATLVPMMEDKDPEVRKAAAWIVSNTLQNNPKDQCKFADKVGLDPILESFDKEKVEEPLKRTFTLISNALRGCKMLREDFYSMDGVKRLQTKCVEFPSLFYRYCWLIGAILDDNDSDDVQVFRDKGVKAFLVEHKKEIDDEEMLKSVVDRLR